MKNLAFAIVMSCAISVVAQIQERSAPDELEFHANDSSSRDTEKLEPVVLPNGQMLIAVTDSVFMVGSDGIVLWRYSTHSPNEVLTSEPAYNATLNQVAVVGTDLLFVRLDATTGKVKWKADTVGRAVFTRVAAYEKGFLVVANMSGYRMSQDDTPVSDTLEYWGESEGDSWSIDFPRRAELVVNGKRIYALKRNGKSSRLLQLHPRATSKSER